MALSIQTLSFKTKLKDRSYEPVLRQGPCRLKPLLCQLSPGSEPSEEDTAASRHVFSLSCLHHRRFVQWRRFQFRDPDDTYVYRARIEPRPPEFPKPPATAATEHRRHCASVSDVK